MRVLRTTEYRRMPWKNGGGSTTEITIAPPTAGLTGEQFIYRVSIADVESDGPFSTFAGCDRHIMLIAGVGMVIDCGDHGHIELTEAFRPRSFSGDWEVRGKLVSGPVRDFNVIVDRARVSATVEVLDIDQPVEMALAAEEVCIAHVLEGRLDIADTGETVVADAPFALKPNGQARIAVARITKR